MAENLMKQPARSILKGSKSFESSSSHKCAASRGTKWDEMNILATHHPPDKDYGHMKIEEPKTPYSYHGEGDSGDEGEASNLDEQLLVSKLGDPTRLAVKRVESVDDSDEEEEILPPEVQEKRRSFEFKRKAHYNEFMAVKLARQLMNNDEEEDEEDAKDKDAKFDENLPDATEDNTEGEKCDDEPDNNVNMDSCTSMDTKDSNDDIFASP